MTIAALGLGGSGSEAATAGGPRARLVEVVEARQRTLTALERRLARARARLRSSSTNATAELGARRRVVAPLADATRLVGPGVEVVLDDGAGPARDPAIDDARRVHDLDLQLVANALWAAGAEALAVNGERLAATTAIRGAGEPITVNFRPQAPPYRIRALGADRDAFARSSTAARFRKWSDLFGLRFDIRSRGRMDLPSHRPALRLRYARPETGGTAWIRPG